MADDMTGSAGGATFDPERDGDRLNRQRKRVWAIMSDHEWHTLYEIAEKVGDKDPTQSIGARIRDLRKKEYGSHTVTSQFVRVGLWRYRLEPTDG